MINHSLTHEDLEKHPPHCWRCFFCFLTIFDCNFALLTLTFRRLARCVIARASRGGGRTEAISRGMENQEIAALPAVARNDEKELRPSPLKGEFERGSYFVGVNSLDREMEL